MKPHTESQHGWTLAFASVAISIIGGCGQPLPSSESEAREEESSLAAATKKAEESSVFEAQMQTFCSDCHAMPRPQSFPKNAWRKEVQRGFEFYYASGRTDLKPPDKDKVISWYQRRAPYDLKLPTVASTEGPLSFTKEEIHLGVKTASMPPAISFIDRIQSTGRGSEYVMSDMRSGVIHFTSNLLDEETHRIEATGHPCAVRIHHSKSEPDALLVADLGSFLPADHADGRLLMYPQLATAGDSPPITLLDNLGRIVDFCVCDFDGDGKDDIAVSEFGWHFTGGVHLLTNTDEAGRLRTFKHTVLDKHPGAIQIIAVDLNADGRKDILTIISQETEQIVAFINRDHGFDRTVIYAAPDPSFGSSGIALADIDNDGDQDIIYTNGDTFDSFLIKPFHSINLLTNQGNLKFTTKRLTTMPGVHRALPADLDGDGDIDIAAVALLPQKTLDSLPKSKQLVSVCWLENIDQEFKHHPIAVDSPAYPALWIGDIDNDSDLDIIAPRLVEEDEDHTHVADVFRNQGQK